MIRLTKVDAKVHGLKWTAIFSEVDSYGRYGRWRVKVDSFGNILDGP